jgi:hypothetical protein
LTQPEVFDLEPGPNISLDLDSEFVVPWTLLVSGLNALEIDHLASMLRESFYSDSGAPAEVFVSRSSSIATNSGSTTFLVTLPRQGEFQLRLGEVEGKQPVGSRSISVDSAVGGGGLVEIRYQ